MLFFPAGPSFFQIQIVIRVDRGIVKFTKLDIREKANFTKRKEHSIFLFPREQMEQQYHHEQQQPLAQNPQQPAQMNPQPAQAAAPAPAPAPTGSSFPNIVVASPTWVVVIRGVQVLLSLVILAMAGYLIHGAYSDPHGFAIACVSLSRPLAQEIQPNHEISSPTAPKIRNITYPPPQDKHHRQAPRCHIPHIYTLSKNPNPKKAHANKPPPP